ncbi:hypothetical protein [Mastigocoleus sp. MO_188.B34]|uniref:hypothetical protein n=1 Tax=Mastigocoleus sp. MO_188.B34 TaxID=3036635 RepID=UPI00261BA99F|nr:hypothetical protein [Mastigocoleus sp. MO_188.B34]MDJ0694528.1 hypothetical protein [Mastigocoleus sp. MO_188.B34]
MTNLPVVSFSVDRTVVAEGGEPQIFTFKLSEPAPSRGLTVRLNIKYSYLARSSALALKRYYKQVMIFLTNLLKSVGRDVTEANADAAGCNISTNILIADVH